MALIPKQISCLMDALFCLNLDLYSPSVVYTGEGNSSEDSSLFEVLFTTSFLGLLRF